jgi:hypothetical protein
VLIVVLVVKTLVSCGLGWLPGRSAVCSSDGFERAPELHGALDKQIAMIADHLALNLGPVCSPEEMSLDLS